METKLRRQIIATFGIAFALIVAMIVIWKLKFYDDVNAKITTAGNSYATAKTEADNLPIALKEEALAKESLTLVDSELASFRSRFRALSFDLTTPGRIERTWQGYMTEYASGYGLEVRAQLLQAAQDSNVTINTSLKVDAPPQVPEAVVAPPSGFLKPVSGGSLTVEAVGAFPDILSFLERINKSPILMTVGAINLEGASPQIEATFTVTPYLLATGPSVPLQAPAGATPPDAAAAGGAAAGDAAPASSAT